LWLALHSTEILGGPKRNCSVLFCNLGRVSASRPFCNTNIWCSYVRLAEMRSEEPCLGDAGM
jgi:hypothetical protein